MENNETMIAELSEILIKRGLIVAKELPAILKGFKDADMDQFDEFLIEQGLVQEADLLEALSQCFQVPAFDVVGYFFDMHLLHEFPKDVLLRCGMIPLEVIDESILIMVANRPDNSDLLPIIGKFVSYDVQFRVGLYRDIADAVKEYYDPSLTEGMAPDIYDDPDLPEALIDEELSEAEGFKDDYAFDIDLLASDTDMEEEEIELFDA